MSTNITEQEAREALRHLEAAKKKFVQPAEDEQDTRWVERDIDSHCWRLACFAIEELSRRDAERAEREKPITAEWCLANGAEGYEAGFEMVYGWDLGWCEFNWREERGCRLYIGDFHFHVNLKHETVGQLDDLLKALRGGE